MKVGFVGVVLAAVVLLLLAALVGILLLPPKSPEPEPKRPQPTTAIPPITTPLLEVEEILRKMKKTMEAVETYSYRMEMVTDSQKFVAEGQVDRKNKRAKFLMHIVGLEWIRNSYVIGNTTYTYYPATGRWYKQEHHSDDPVFRPPLFEWIGLWGPELVGEEVVDGHECYVFSYVFKYEEYEGDFHKEWLSWVDKRTFYERKFVEVRHRDGESMSVITIVRWGFNEPVEIELPPEAEKAEVLPTSPTPLV